MANSIPEHFQDLVRDETRAMAVLATTMEDGSPQSTPVWFNMGGSDILINSAGGRVKDRNMRARPRIALTIIDPRSFERYMQVRGTVVDITEEGAREHISTLSKKYRDEDIFVIPEGAVRYIYRIHPDHVSGEN